MAERQTTINNVTINSVTINVTLNEPPSGSLPAGSQRNWVHAAIKAILRTMLIIALFHA